MAALGVDLELAQRQRRAFARQCLDWSERKVHLAGALGAAKKPVTCAAKKKLSTQDAIALVEKMVAAGKLDQATADKKLAYLAGK